MWTEVGSRREKATSRRSVGQIILLHAPRLQIPKTGKGKKASKPVNKDRFVNKMFLRGDSVVLVL